MRKFTLICCALLSVWTAQAQLSLSGTSYSQNFNTIDQGLPTGWGVYTDAHPAVLGTDVSSSHYTATAGLWNNTAGGFKNFASANNFANYYLGTTANQNSATDRALGVRQVAIASSSFPGSDFGAAFVLQIANTINLSNFVMNFKLQSLDSNSSRSTLWSVDYGIGAVPTSFTQATTVGTMTTGGNTYSNNSITANFGTALDNVNDLVWIRIVALNASTGSGNRPTTGIDDVQLTWNGTPIQSYRPIVLSTTPTDNATGVVPGANLSIEFDRSVTAGVGNIYVKNQNNQTIQTIASNASNVSINGTTVTVSNVTLAHGADYHVTFDSAAFDTASFKSYGIYDTTAWSFSTAMPIVTVTSLNEKFDTCSANMLPYDWNQRSVLGDAQTWRCGGSSYATMNAGASAVLNEDWLISPKLNLAAMTNPLLTWRTRWRFTGPALEVYASSDYSGYGDPNAANWANIPVNYLPADSNQWHDQQANLTAFKSTPFFIAYKYTANPTDGSSQWDVDSVVVEDFLSIKSATTSNLPLRVVGIPTHHQLQLQMTSERNAPVQVTITDVAGKMVHRSETLVNKGVQLLTISTPYLPSGMYVIRIAHNNQWAVTRTIVP